MKLLTVLMALLLFTGCTQTKQTEETVTEPVTDSLVTYIELNGDSATINSAKINESDYTWHVDPYIVHDEVKNAPAEYYTGTKSEEDIYIDHDLQYYPILDLNDYELINYDGEREYAFYYQDGENDNYIFATLPNLNNDVITSMMHSEDEASMNKVLHITKGGEYEISGSFNGQIRFECSEEEKITVTFNNADINCTVAPGVVFASAYECGGEYSDDFNIDDAGVRVILKGNNTVSGNNIYRMLKNTYKTDSDSVQKKVRKIDSPFYSYVSMIIEGDGSLTVNSNFEGMGSEMHLSFLSGNVTINSVDDGINVNEDNVSVVSFLGSNVTINHKNGSEGDGVDSNGYIVVDGGTLNINGVYSPDNALDSEDGITYKSGTVNIDGEEKELSPGSYREINGNNQGFGHGGGFGKGDMGQGKMERPEGMPEGFEGRPDDMFRPDNREFDIKQFKEDVSGLSDDATIEDVLKLLGYFR